MVNFNLLKCAFDKHECGSMLHDDIMNRWIRICKHCGKTIKVSTPKDENGKPIDPHVWIRTENERSEAELLAILPKIV